MEKQNVSSLLEEFHSSGRWAECDNDYHCDIYQTLAMILVMSSDYDSILFGKNGTILRFPLNMLQCNGFRDAIVIVQVISSSNVLHVIFKMHNQDFQFSGFGENRNSKDSRKVWAFHKT